MKRYLPLTLLVALMLALAGGGAVFASGGGPAAPTLLAPANGAQVTTPVAISWSAVSDSKGISAYNWQVSSSSSMSPVVTSGSTGGATQDTVSGLSNATYFWRVQAVNGENTPGSWSSVRSFSVTGSAGGGSGAPTLNQPQAYNTFHPYEVEHWTWSAVPGAASYIFEASTNPSFPITTEFRTNNIPDPSYGFALVDEGNYFARVSAADANGNVSAPSNVVTFSVFFNNPLPPPPTPLEPADGASVTLPVTFTWTDVPNPQPSGYTLEVATDASFNNIEFLDNQITPASKTLLSLTSGTKYWRVNSAQGDSSPTLPAVTAWSPTRSFVVPATPPNVGSLAVNFATVSNGATETVSVQLTGPAPAGGAVIALHSSDPAVAPMPSTFTMAAGLAWDQFRFQIGSVTVSEQVTLTASLNGSSASVTFTANPPALKSLTLSPSTITGGAQPTLIVMLNGQAPAGGLTVNLSSDSPAANPPTTATVAAGDVSVSVNIPTSAVTTNTLVTLSATQGGKTLQAQVTLTPAQPPDSLTLSQTTVTGTTSVNGTVRLASPATTDTTIQLSSSDAAVTVPNGVLIPQGAIAGGFFVNVSSVTTQTVVTISATGAGVTKTATLTLNPVGGGGGATLASLTLSPTSIRGGQATTGTVALSAAAPAGGAVITLSSGNTSLATVPASVTIPAGATSATFTVSTKSVNSDATVTISGSYGGGSQSATLTVTRR